MISKEEYKKYIYELTKNDENNKDLSYLSSKRSSKFGMLTIIGFLIIVIGFIFAFNLIFIVIGVVMLVSGIIGSNKEKQINNHYKDKYIENILQRLLEGYNYTFDRYGQVSEGIFRQSHFVYNYDRYKGMDKLSINIPNDDNSKSNSNLTLCDLNVIKREEDDDGNTKDVSVYEGVFGYVDFPCEFKCLLSINTKYKKFGVTTEKVKLEDINFHKKFGVYCSDQVEARYILTPDMMDKLMMLQEKFNVIKLVLVDNRMYIGFPNVNLLELGSYKDDIITIFDDLYDDVYNILSLVNEIKNNNKVFKM